MRDWPPTYIRLARGASVSQLAGLFPDLRFRTLRGILHPGESGALPMLFGAAVLLLIVTWVQVAALMLSGAIEQLRDIGVRLALGAGRARLLRQFAVQSALLAAVSAVLAWMILSPLTVAIIEMLPSELSRGKYLTPDFRAFAFSCALSVIGFGVVTVVPLCSRVAPRHWTFCIVE
jgi:ABC-type antimicrobial peptide transport system permease subunit